MQEALRLFKDKYGCPSQDEFDIILDGWRRAVYSHDSREQGKVYVDMTKQNGTKKQFIDNDDTGRSSMLKEGNVWKDKSGDDKATRFRKVPRHLEAKTIVETCPRVEDSKNDSLNDVYHDCLTLFPHAVQMLHHDSGALVRFQLTLAFVGIVLQIGLPFPDDACKGALKKEFANYFGKFPKKWKKIMMVSSLKICVDAICKN